MSFQTLLASDLPMNEVENSHVKLLSVNEAIKKGVKLPEMVVNSNSIDRDKPGVILWADSEDNMGEIEIRTEEKSHLGRTDSLLETGMQYFLTLEWRYTKDRAEKLIAYIREHLKKAAEVEIWNLWVGYEESAPTTRKHIVFEDALTAGDFDKLFFSGQRNGDWQQYDCLSVKRNPAVRNCAFGTH